MTFKKIENTDFQASLHLNIDNIPAIKETEYVEDQTEETYEKLSPSLVVSPMPTVFKQLSKIPPNIQI